MYNPARRNRNIGTAKQGYGANNKLVIPYPCAVDKSFFERLGPYDKEIKSINGKEFIFVIEKTIGDFKHACSVGDVEHILHTVPTPDLADLNLIVMRQPKRKETILTSPWGRLIYSYEFEKAYHRAIIIEAVDFSKNCHGQKVSNLKIKLNLKGCKMTGISLIKANVFIQLPLYSIQ